MQWCPALGVNRSNFANFGIFRHKELNNLQGSHGARRMKCSASVTLLNKLFKVVQSPVKLVQYPSKEIQIKIVVVVVIKYI